MRPHVRASLRLLADSLERLARSAAPTPAPGALAQVTPALSCPSLLLVWRSHDSRRVPPVVAAPLGAGGAERSLLLADALLADAGWRRASAWERQANGGGAFAFVEAAALAPARELPPGRPAVPGRGLRRVRRAPPRGVSTPA